MFIFFAENRANYRKGQVFPFLIAIIVIIVIMAMITANLGKLAIFKTDVSNAADAGSLSAVSVLSTFLLQIGLESDTWCGNAMVTVTRMTEIFILARDDFNISGISLVKLLASVGVSGGEKSKGDLKEFPADLIACIKLYVPYMIGFYFAYQKALWNGEITWASAKQKALSGAFNNAGVDEGVNPAMKFKNFICKANESPQDCQDRYFDEFNRTKDFGCRPNESSKDCYDRYLNKYMNKEAHATGFLRFMNHPISGYGEAIGEIKPGSGSPTHITSGYGWSQIINPGAADDESFSGSYPGDNKYKDYDNYVEVQVKGSSSYPLEPLTWSDFRVLPTIALGIVFIGAFIKYYIWGMKLCEEGWIGLILALIFAAISTAFYAMVLKTLPVGYTFPGDMEKYTDDNPIKLQVTRYKKNTDMGIWNFQYGRVIAKSAGHAFVDKDNGSTIEPAFTSGFSFSAEKHLFETELVKGSVE